MNGTTFISSVYLPGTPTEWQIGGTGDFNADNNVDIVWQDTVTGQRGIWLMNGTSYSNSVNLPVAELAWEIKNH